jgi:hypothetical protein
LTTRKFIAAQGPKWKFAKIIQRHYRNYKREQAGLILSKNVWLNALKMSKGLGTELTVKRQNAVDLIVTFCRDLSSGFKAQVLSFIRAVKKCQSLIRRHLRRNANRRQMVQNVLELYLPVLLQNLQCVFSGKGLDIATNTIAERHHLEKLLTNFSPHASIRNVPTPAFHAYLRNNMPLAKEFLRQYNMVNGRTMPFEKRKHVILGAIFRKRRAMIHQIELERAGEEA